MQPTNDIERHENFSAISLARSGRILPERNLSISRIRLTPVRDRRPAPVPLRQRETLSTDFQLGRVVCPIPRNAFRHSPSVQ